MGYSRSRQVLIGCAALLAAAQIGCGDSGDSGAASPGAAAPSGAYVPKADGIYDRLEFLPDLKVSVTFFGQVKTVEYVIMPDGRISIFGDKVQKLRDRGDGCLVLLGAGDDGAEMDLPDFGIYCRE